MDASKKPSMAWLVAATVVTVIGLLVQAEFWSYPTPRPPEAVRLANTWSQMPR